MPHAPVALTGLRHQIELRQLRISDLAAAAGITFSTARRAVAGEPVSVQTFRRITEALARIPIDPVAALALGVDTAEVAQITQILPTQPVHRRRPRHFPGRQEEAPFTPPHASDGSRR